MTDSAAPDDLRIKRSRWSRLPWLVLAVLLVAVAGWYVTHPNPLPTTSAVLTATTPVGEPVYVAVLAPGYQDRTLVVRGIDVDPTGEVPVGVEGKVCLGGSIAVSSDPEAFCTSLVDAEGTSVGPGDVLVLEITGDTPGEVDLGQVRVSYREGLQWGSSLAGPPVTVTFLSR